MATAIRSSSVAVGADTAPTVAAPTGTTTGDVVVVIIYANSAGSFADNNGSTPFTEDLADFQETNNGSCSSIFSRRIQGGDPSTYAFTGPNEKWTVVAICFSGPDPTTIYDVAPTSTNSSAFAFTGTPTSDDITTATGGAFHVVACGMDASVASIDGTPATYTVLQQTNNTTGMAFAAAYKAIASPAATGAQSWTPSASNGSITHSFAVKAAASSSAGIMLKLNNFPNGINLIHGVA